MLPRPRLRPGRAGVNPCPGRAPSDPAPPFEKVDSYRWVCFLSKEFPDGYFGWITFVFHTALGFAWWMIISRILNNIEKQGRAMKLTGVTLGKILTQLLHTFSSPTYRILGLYINTQPIPQVMTSNSFENHQIDPIWVDFGVPCI